MRQLERWGFDFLDCQMHTPHLERMGAVSWPRKAFLEALARSVGRKTRRGRWRLDESDAGA